MAISRAVFADALYGTAKIIGPDVMLAPVVYGKDKFTKLRWRIREGIQDKHELPMYMRKGKITKPYKPGMNKENIGSFEMRELKVYLSAAFSDINIQEFNSVKVGENDLLGTNKEPKVIPFAEEILWGMAKSFAESQIDDCVFGKYDPSGESAHPNFDGLQTLYDIEIKRGTISEKNLNLIKTGEISAPADANDTTAFDTLFNFYQKLHPGLKGAKELMIATTVEAHTNIISAYANKYKIVLTRQDLEAGMVFIGMPNVRLVSDDIFGKGDKLFAYVPDMVDVGVDSVSDDEFIDVTQEPSDKNIFHLQMQARMGMRINSVSPKLIAFSDGEWTESVSPIGDYNNATVVAYSNEETLGTVAVSPQKDSYAIGEEVTITATPTATGQFSKWGNGVTTNPLKITVEGAPIAIEAIFTVKPTE